MASLAHRSMRIASAGLLGLLLAAPPPAAADDDDRRGRATRSHPSARDDEHRDARGREESRRREDRRDHGQPPRARSEHERGERRARIERAAPPARAPQRARDDDRRDRHEQGYRAERRDRHAPRAHGERRHAAQDDRREWHEERHRNERKDWQDRHRREREHRHEGRRILWNHARYTAHHDRHWHWHGDRWCPPGHRHPPGRRVGWHAFHRDDWRWARYRRPVIVHSGYYCAPCSGWYGDRHAFDRHVFGHHGLPRLSFGDAVAQMVWGLVYFGL